MVRPKVVLLIFVSGKVVLTGRCGLGKLIWGYASTTWDGRMMMIICKSTTFLVHSTGAKRREDIYTAFEQIYPVLKMFRKGTEASATTSQAAADDAAVMAMAVCCMMFPHLLTHHTTHIIQHTSYNTHHTTHIQDQLGGADLQTLAGGSVAPSS